MPNSARERKARSRASAKSRLNVAAAQLAAQYAGLAVEASDVIARLKSGGMPPAEHARHAAALAWSIAERVLRRGDEIDPGDYVQLAHHERRLVQVADLVARAARIHLDAEATSATPTEDQTRPIVVSFEAADPSVSAPAVAAEP